MATRQKPIGIPEPVNHVDSLWRTTQALKEAVEVLQGVRGNRAAVIQGDIVATTTTSGGGGGASPGGSDTQVQYNNAGSFAGSADFTWDETNTALSIGDHFTIEDQGGIAGTSGITDFLDGTGAEIMRFYETDGGGARFNRNRLRFEGGRGLALWSPGDVTRNEVYSNDDDFLYFTAENITGTPGALFDYPVYVGNNTNTRTPPDANPANKVALWSAQWSSGSGTTLMATNFDANSYPVENRWSVVYMSNTAATSATDPGSERMKQNTNDFATVTELYFDDISYGENDTAYFWTMAQPGDMLRISQGSDTGRWVYYNITTITDNTGWYTIDVTVLDHAGTDFINGDTVVVDLLPTSQTGIIDAGTTTGRFASWNNVSGRWEETNMFLELASTVQLNKTLDIVGGADLRVRSDNNGVELIINMENTGLVDYRITGTGTAGAEGHRFRDFPLYIEESADDNNNLAGYGQIWVRNDVPNTLMFTDDAGNQHDLTAEGLTGTGVDNQVAVWSGASSLDSSAGFTWDGSTLGLADNELSRPEITDFGVTHQSPTVTGNAVTVDLTLGNSAYIDMDPATAAVTLTLSNPPASGTYGEVNLIIEMGTPAHDITWPGSVVWQGGGSAPSLTTLNNTVDLVHLFTVDGGTTWYGSYSLAAGFTPGGPADGTVESSLLRWNDSGGSWDEMTGVRITADRQLRLYDSTFTDYANFVHDGDDFSLTFVNTTDFNVGANTLNRVRFEVQASGIYDFIGGATIRLWDGTTTDRAEWSHDGTDFTQNHTGTTDWNVTGLSGFNVVNYNFDVDQTVGAGQDNYVLTYDNGTGLISLEAAAGGGASALNDLSDVTITSAATGDILRYNGSAWVDYPDSNYARLGVATNTFNSGTGTQTVEIANTSGTGEKRFRLANSFHTLGKDFAIASGADTWGLYSRDGSRWALQFDESTDYATFGGYDLDIPSSLIISGGADTWTTNHNGTNVITSMVNTTDWAIDGASLALHTNTNATPLKIRRLGNDDEALFVGIDDNTATFAYRQDETTGTHVIAWDYQNQGGGNPTGVHYMEMRYEGTWRHRFYMDSGRNGYYMAGGEMRVYDDTVTDYLQFSHNGSNAGVTVNAGSLQFAIANNFDILNGSLFFVRDSDNDQYLQLSADGTDIVASGVATTDWRFETGISRSIVFESQALDHWHGGGEATDQIRHIMYPQGGMLKIDNSNQSGAILITFPVSAGNGNMTNMVIRGYDYTSTHNAWAISIGFYDYGATDTFLNYSVSVIAGNPPFGYVEFQTDDTTDQMYIQLGDETLTSNLQYPQVWIESLNVGFSNQSTAALADNWTMALTTSKTGRTAVGTRALLGHQSTSSNIYQFYATEVDYVYWRDGQNHRWFDDADTEYFEIEATPSQMNLNATQHIQLSPAVSHDVLVFRLGGTAGLRVYDSTGSDYGRISHDGTNLNIATVNTADINIGETGTRVHLPSGSDAGLATTNHPFQVGADGSSNIRMDNNEIIAVNNGAVSQLNLNTDGGDVALWSNAANGTGLLLHRGANIRIYGPDNSSYLDFSHDNTDATLSVNSTTEFNIGVDTNFIDNKVIRPEIDDYSITSTTATVSTNNVTCTYAVAQSYEVDLEAATGNVTITLSGGPPSGTYGEMIIKVQQDTTAARTITWSGGTFRWPAGTAPTMSPGADDIDIYHFSTWDGGTTWYGSAIQDMS